MIDLGYVALRPRRPVQLISVNIAQQPTNCPLTRERKCHPEIAPPRAQLTQQRLRQVCNMISHLPKIRRPSQHCNQ